MEFGFTTAAYVVSAVLFILSLGGLSGQESAKRAVWYGIAGMALAVAATLIGPGSGFWLLSLVLIAGGGAIGYQLATKVQMTQMPELVAAMHSLVGLAAVFVGFVAHVELGRVMAMDDAARKGLEGFAALLAKKDGAEIAILRGHVRDQPLHAGPLLGGHLRQRLVDLGACGAGEAGAQQDCGKGHESAGNGLHSVSVKGPGFDAICTIMQLFPKWFSHAPMSTRS